MTSQPPPMQAEDVPDELVDAIYAVIHRTCPRCIDADPPPADLDDVMCPTCLDTRSIGPIVHDAEGWAAAIAAAVLPAHEAAVRARVAQQIEEMAADLDDGSLWAGGAHRAAQVARGET